MDMDKHPFEFDVPRKESETFPAVEETQSDFDVIGERAWSDPAVGLAMALLAGLYVIAGKLGLLLAFVHSNATAVWPPTGITLAAFLILGYRVWPGIFLGAFLVNISTAGSVATSIGIATGNTLEGVAGAYLVNRFARGRLAFHQGRDVLAFAALAGLGSTTVSATFGVTSLALGGFADWAHYGSIWLTWWMGDVSGALLVAPLLVLWATHPRPQWSRAQRAEAALLCAVSVLVALTVFGGLIFANAGRYPLEYLSIPCLVWAAYRFGPRETATANIVLAVPAIWGTLRGFGPFAVLASNESLLLLQAFLCVTSVSALTFAAVVSKKRRIERSRDLLLGELEEALIQIKTLRGLIPICSSCKRIRNDEGYWEHVESYIQQHSLAQFSHGVCPDCVIRLYTLYQDKK